MNDSIYKMVYKSGLGELVEKKSRFIANVYNIKTEEDVSSYMNGIKKQYWDARHNCFAYVIGDNNQIQRCSDDGEPAGTAGKPILDVIIGSNLHNCLIVVTRYFGGTLLGTGGLVRAYQEASKIGLNHSIITDKIFGNRYIIITDYNGMGKILYTAELMKVNVLDVQYSEEVRIQFIVPINLMDPFEKQVADVTSGQAVIQNQGKQCFTYDNGKVILITP